MRYFNTKWLFKLLCLSLTILIPVLSVAQVVPQGYSVICNLPVNVALPVRERVCLVVQAPKGYKCLQEDLKPEFLEFIPEKDLNPYQWSEIITSQCYIGKGLVANQLLLLIASSLLEKTNVHKIIGPSLENFNTYRASSMTIFYTSHGRKELVYLQYFSGPYDCSGFQYAIELTDEMTEEVALAKIQKFKEEAVWVGCF